MQFFSRLLAVLTLVFSVGFPVSAAEKSRVLVVGDSLLDWHSLMNSSVPDVLARVSGRDVVNRSANGAKFYLTGAGDTPQSVIPAQYQSGAWDWVLVNGGANDLFTKCGCKRCDAVMNRMISSDADRGILVDLVKKARADGARVLVIGYYKGNARRNLFTPCRKAVVELVARQRKLSNRMKGVEFFSPSPAIDPQNRRHFALDGFHLSRLGAKRVGKLLAARLSELDQRSK